MHYGAYAFANNTAIPTIIPLDDTAVIGQRNGFSDVSARRFYSPSQFANSIVYICFPVGSVEVEYAVQMPLIDYAGGVAMQPFIYHSYTRW